MRVPRPKIFPGHTLSQEPQISSSQSIKQCYWIGMWRLSVFGWQLEGQDWPRSIIFPGGRHKLARHVAGRGWSLHRRNPTPLSATVRKKANSPISDKSKVVEIYKDQLFPAKVLSPAGDAKILREICSIEKGDIHTIKQKIPGGL